MRLGWTEHFGPRMQYKTKPIYGSYFFLESRRSFAHLFVKEKVRLLVTIDERKANRLSRWKRGNFLERTCTTHSVLMLVTSAARSWHSSWKTRLLLSRWTDQLRRITINQTLFAATSRPSSWLSLSLTVVQTSKNTPTLAIIFYPLVVVAYRSFCFFCAKLTKTLKLWEPFCKSICKTASRRSTTIVDQPLGMRLLCPRPNQQLQLTFPNHIAAAASKRGQCVWFASCWFQAHLSLNNVVAMQAKGRTCTQDML